MKRIFKASYAHYQIVDKSIDFLSKTQAFENAHRLTPLALGEEQ